jgi:hypothetical protein
LMMDGWPPFAHFFDADGNFLQYEERPLPCQPECHPVTGVPLDHEKFEAEVERWMTDWREEIGFTPEPIRVRKFYLEKEGLGIEDRMEMDEEFLRAPELVEPDPEERAERLGAIRDWDADGSFIFYCGTDYFLNGEGEVTSS